MCVYVDFKFTNVLLHVFFKKYSSVAFHRKYMYKYSFGFMAKDRQISSYSSSHAQGHYMSILLEDYSY